MQNSKWNSELNLFLMLLHLAFILMDSRCLIQALAIYDMPAGRGTMHSDCQWHAEDQTN